MCPGPLLASVDTVWVIVLFAFYVVPTLIALARRTALLVMVFALNLFLGWTIVGWAVSLALAMLLPPVRPAGAGVVPGPAVAPAATVTPMPAPPTVGVNPAEPPAALEFLLSPARVAVMSVLAPVFYQLWWFWRFFRFAQEERFPRARSFWCIFFPFYGWAVIGRLFHDLEDRLGSNRPADFNAQVAVALVVAGDVGAGWAARLPILLALVALGLSVVCTAVALYQVQTAANAYLCTKYPGGQGAGLIPAELFAAMAGLLLVSLLVLEAAPNLSDLAASTSRATTTVSPRPSSFQFPTGFPTPVPTSSPTAPAGPAYGSGVLSLSSAQGDYIGQGRDVTVSSPTWRFLATPSSGRDDILIQANSSDGWLSVDLAAPRGQVLRPGTYKNAERASFRSATAPGIDVTGQGRGCNQAYGSFTVTTVIIDAHGRVTAFEANFEEHCETQTAPPLRGSVRFSATDSSQQAAARLALARLG